MDVLIGRDETILTIEFNRPHKKNALTSAMYEAMADAIEAAEADAGIRVILFSGKPEIFSAGNDLEEFLRSPPQGDTPPVYRFMNALQKTEKPVMAAVSGKAIGIGATLLLHCDLIYAAEGATLAMPFTQLGLCPEFGSSLLLPRLGGHQRAAEALLLGESFTVAQAAEWGLVNQVVPADALLPTAFHKAKKLAALPPASLRATKRLLKAETAEGVAQRIREEMKIFRELLVSPEAREIFEAFFQKQR